MTSSPNDRFNRLLGAMLNGPAPSGKKKPSTVPASGEASDACCDDTQTPKDTLKDMVANHV